MDAPSLFNVEIWQLLLALSVFTVFIVKYFKQQKYDNLPPIYTGWLPWLGCALEFGRFPLTFIQQKHKELGSVFTLYVTGERFTFIMEAEDFDKFLSSSNVDFQQAVQDPTNRVASLSKDAFFKYHTKIHDSVKGKLAASKLACLSESLCHDFRETQQQYSNGKENLVDMVIATMYPVVLNNLFGKNILPIQTKEQFEILKKHFVMFDDQFEYGSKLPGFILKEWSASKEWLLKTFTSILNNMNISDMKGEEGKESLLQIVCAIADKDSRANYSMLFMWASLANAIPITFWTLAFIMENKDILEKAKQQVDAVLKSTPHVTESSLRQMPYIKWCILEAIRLRSPGVIARKVIKSFTLKGMTIPEGDMLMVSPYWAHRNTKYFPDPEKFYPERWENADLEKSVFLPGFIAFGGGRYQCPGRWFALLEMHMYIALFLQRFDSHLIDPVPAPSTLHVVGTQQPCSPCAVQYSLRQHSS